WSLAQATSEAISAVTVAAAAITRVDFGFNFDTVTNTNDSGAGSLRQVILNANALGGEGALSQAGRTAGREHVVFMVSNGGNSPGLRAANNLFTTRSGNHPVAALAPANPLPAITGPLTLDAQTQPGWSGLPLLDIDGAGAGPTAQGLTIGAEQSVVRGFTLRRFAQSGVLVSANNVTVQGNHLGTNPAGTVAEGNAHSGVHSSGTGTVIGGSTASHRNLISGNAQGVYLTGSDAVVTGNYIGTTATGTAKLPNTGFGVGVMSNVPARIGGPTAAERNVIGGNGSDGIYARGTPSIQGNSIGVGADGSSNIGNTRHGIAADCSGGGSVGGTASGAGNLIANNGANGVLVTDTCRGLSIRGNSIHGHAQPGIDLGTVPGGAGNGVSANDGAKSATQANQGMDAPVLTSASLSAGVLNVTGYVGSAAGQALFADSQVEVYLADSGGAAPSGRTYLGTVTADASGNIKGSIALQGPSAITAGITLVGTATDGSGNTSEFGPALAYGRVVAGTVFEDLNYGGGAGRSRAAAGGVGLANATLELIGSDGVLLATTTTAADGGYRFVGVGDGHFFVRVVQGSVRSSRPGSGAAVVGVQTWRHEASWSSPGPVTNEVGGSDPAATDGAAGVARYGWKDCAPEWGTCAFTGTRLVRYGANSTWTTRVLTGGTACTNSVFGDPLVGVFKACQLLDATLHSVSSASTLGSDVGSLDFGFNFSTVVNTQASGAGSLAQVVSNANALGNDNALTQAGRSAGVEHVVFMIPNGSTATGDKASGGKLALNGGLRAGLNAFSGGMASIVPGSRLLVNQSLVIDAQTQPGWTANPVVELVGTGAPATHSGVEIGGGTCTVRGLVVNRWPQSGLHAFGGSGHLVQGNFIGTNAAATAALPNQTGITVLGVASAVIGGSDPLARNVVSGNSGVGIDIQGNATGTVIHGNHVGPDATGNARIGNGAAGIVLRSPGVAMGGVGAGNVVAGNGGTAAVEVLASATGAVIQGNTLGLGADGNTALANPGDGLQIRATGIQVGGTATGAGNVISGFNSAAGIAVFSGANNVVIEGNTIGLNAARGLARPNGHGVWFQSGTSGARVGGSTAAATNVIAGNAMAGVVVVGNTSGVRIQRNGMWGNAGLGIDLSASSAGGDGATPNDGTLVSGAPNRGMDVPALTAARARGSQLTVTGYVGLPPGTALFGGATVDVYIGDGSANPAGRTWLGSFNTAANGSFTGTVTAPVAALSLGTVLTATATDGSGNTSEFGPGFTGLLVDFIVNTTADDADASPGDGRCLTAAGLCSLRAAIAELNAQGPQATTPTIAFGLPGCSASGQAACRIAPTTVLPTVARAVAIDGSTQPGFDATTAAPLVELNGATAPANAIGLVVNTGGFTLRGLVVNRWGSHGLSLGGSGSTVAGNWFGVAATGADAAGNGGSGLEVTGTGHQIGGSTLADRNVASGNGSAGIALRGSGNTVTGNVVGLLPDGLTASGNRDVGILASAANQTIGGS
ncbi:MAG: 3-dehydroshikimate dehydratase, partial [Pseudomonadota bacterium]